MTEPTLGARGVFVTWTPGGFAYHFNPKTSRESGAWHDVVPRYEAIDRGQVGPLIDAAARGRSLHGVLGALAGLSVAGVVMLGSEALLAALAVGGFAGAATSFLARRKTFALAYDTSDPGLRNFVLLLGTAASSIQGRRRWGRFERPRAGQRRRPRQGSS